jgi:UDPglucose--hexose-1-phosphate uridylyltransferase
MEGSMVGLTRDPHRRHNPLTDQWVLVSAGRTERPWLGQEEARVVSRAPAYDPDCYMCPGNRRASGAQNPGYPATFVFDNDFPALRAGDTLMRFEEGLLRAQGVSGVCRVVSFGPRHDTDLAELPAGAVRNVIDTWADQTAELGRRFPWVQVFENRGAQMGASNPHPHGQIWAGSTVPTVALVEARTQAEYAAAHGRSMLIDYVAQEEGGERVVEADEEWLVVVPFWAVWPFETLVLPRRPIGRLPDLDPPQRDALAAVLIRLLVRYDALFGVPFPYSMGWHQAPFGDAAEGWQLHAHYYPPLLRSASVRKFMVGYELLSEAQRDLSAEQAADRLRSVGGDPPGTA